MGAGAQNGRASSPTMKAFSEPWIRPTAPGIGPYQVHETEQGLRFDTKEAAEYPWDFCTAYAAGVRVAMDRRNPSACGLGGA